MNQFCEIFKTIPSSSTTGISEGNEKRKRKKIFQEIIAGHFPNVVEDNNIQSQGGQQITSKKHTKARVNTWFSN